MEDKKTLKDEVALKAISEGKTEIIFRNGEAEKITPKVKKISVSLAGTISSCSEFYLKRPEQFDEKRAHIIFSKNPEKLFIELKTNENKESAGYNVKGTLELSEEMKNFGIGYKISTLPKMYTISDLSKMLRFNKRLFLIPDQAMKVIEGLAKFSSKVTADVAQIENARGNQSGSYNIQVDSSIPMSFSIMMPLFKGKPAKNFDVNICFDVKGVKEIVLWLESVELSSFIQEDASNFIDEELKKLSTIVQIEV